MYLGLHVKCPKFFSRFQPKLKFIDRFSLSLQYQISRKSVQQDVGYMYACRILRRPIGVALDTCGQTGGHGEVKRRLSRLCVRA